MQKSIIFILGKAATGKSVLAEKILTELRIPVVSYDEIKETIFEQTGKTDDQTWHAISKASYDLMFNFFDNVLVSSNSVVVESNLNPETNLKTIQDLQQKHDAKIVQIKLLTDSEVLIKRLQGRVGKVHFCHKEEIMEGYNLEEMKKKLRKNNNPKIDIESAYIQVDTTDFKKINYQEIFDKIKNTIE